MPRLGVHSLQTTSPPLGRRDSPSPVAHKQPIFLVSWPADADAEKMATSRFAFPPLFMGRAVGSFTRSSPLLLHCPPVGTVVLMFLTVKCWSCGIFGLLVV